LRKPIDSVPPIVGEQENHHKGEAVSQAADIVGASRSQSLPPTVKEVSSAHASGSPGSAPETQGLNLGLSTAAGLTIDPGEIDPDHVPCVSNFHVAAIPNTLDPRASHVCSSTRVDFQAGDA
jgi:hypothetical protein